MDIAADLAYSHKMGQMEKKESSAHLRALWEANFFVTVHTTSKKFPLLGWLQYFTVPPSTIAHYITALKENKAAFTERLENRDSSQHMDHFHELLPPDGAPITKKELDGLEMSCHHLVIAGFEPISTNFLCCIAFSLQDKECYRRLVEEIRGSFARYEDMTADSLLSLKYLHATIMEELRMAVIASSGLPRVSPGATIDGHYIQKGVEVQYGNYAFTRSNRYFHDAFNFHPERWLPQDHPYYDPVYANDALDDFHPWGLGVRGCPGKSLAIQQARIILAKVLWTFDAERLPGQSMNFERDFKMYGMLEKPQYWVRLLER
jgi:cytochrome P450